ncbi:hypothetical protein [Flavitalea sp.]|nr:hypothetical protein [Flavitalea sp.]
MFNNVVLDVFMGLIFIYLLYSLLASIVQEFIAGRLNLRARMLQKAIRRMLEDHASPTGNAFQRSTFYNYFFELVENIRRFFKPFRDNELFARKFYNQPGIKYLGEDKAFSKPAYLRPQNFSFTIIRLLRGPDYDGSTQNEAELIKNTLDKNTLNITAETLYQFRSLFADARQDVSEFRNRLDEWFDETMQRTNGWYKQQTQTILLFIGFFIAVIFNVDTVAITKILSKDKKVREQIVQLAFNNKINPDSVYLMLAEDASSTQHLFGLEHSNSRIYQANPALKTGGWIITALAISLGAPFWFDLLNKVTQVRSSGSRVPTGKLSSHQLRTNTEPGDNSKEESP